MSQQELLNEVVGILRALHIEFMLTGSHASSLQGEPRSTHDIDLVVNLHARQVPALARAFSSDRFYISETAALEAVRSQRMFNVLETNTGEKVDFWILNDSPFDRERFFRRQTVKTGELEFEVSSPEDTILMKLQWCRMYGGSEKQFQDALHVYELQVGMLDVDYIRRWAETLGVSGLWTRVVDEAQPFEQDGGE